MLRQEHAAGRLPRRRRGHHARSFRHHPDIYDRNFVLAALADTNSVAGKVGFYGFLPSAFASTKTFSGLCKTLACTNGRARASVSLAWSPYPHNRQNGREFSHVAYQARGGLPGTGIADTPHRYAFNDHGSEVANSATNCPRS
jgi:hypothetical protein